MCHFGSLNPNLDAECGRVAGVDRQILARGLAPELLEVELPLSPQKNMAQKLLTFDTEARDAVLAGVEKLAKAVVSTLGPKGRCAILDKSWGGPTVTKDGVTVAREFPEEWQVPQPPQGPPDVLATP